jgi:hypothetical protein
MLKALEAVSLKIPDYRGMSALILSLTSQTNTGRERFEYLKVQIEMVWPSGAYCVKVSWEVAIAASFAIHENKGVILESASGLFFAEEPESSDLPLRTKLT